MKTPKYESQRIAFQYFGAAALFFGLQIVVGLLLGAKYVWDADPLLYVLPFNTARALHINLLVVWLLLGFMGGTYYLIPEETQSEIYSPALARIQLYLFVAGALAIAVSYLAGWSWGMPFLEQPLPLKAAIVVVALIFLFNILMTSLRAKKWTVIQAMLIAGLGLLAVFFLAGMFFMRNLSTQYFWWWWVIHLWVEGAWELIAASIMGFMLLKLTGVERPFIEKWLYVEAGLVLFTGIAGTGHHYYWIGTPGYWLWVGGIFSALEPLPILLMVIDTLRHVRERKIQITNRLALYWAVGCAVLHFIGAGVWGFAHTLPAVNKWTHGTQVTSSHGHFAFFGAYAMLNLTMFAFVLAPGRQQRGQEAPRMGMSAFWVMSSSMVLMALSLAVAGIIQTYIQRILGVDYLTTQGFMKLWYTAFWVSAWGFTAGLAAFLVDFFRRLAPGRA